MLFFFTRHSNPPIQWLYYESLLSELPLCTGRPGTSGLLLGNGRGSGCPGLGFGFNGLLGGAFGSGIISSQVNNMDFTNKRASYLNLAAQAVEQQHDSFLELDKKAWQVIGTSSIIVGAVAAFNLKAILDHTITVPENVLWFLGAAAIAYLTAIWSALWAIAPKVFMYPFQFDWDTIKEVSVKDDDDYFTYLMAGLSKCIEENADVLNKKARLVLMSTICIGVTVMMVVVAAVLAVID